MSLKPGPNHLILRNMWGNVVKQLMRGLYLCQSSLRLIGWVFFWYHLLCHKIVAIFAFCFFPFFRCSILVMLKWWWISAPTNLSSMWEDSVLEQNIGSKSILLMIPEECQNMQCFKLLLCRWIINPNIRKLKPIVNISGLWQKLGSNASLQG